MRNGRLRRYLSDSFSSKPSAYQVIVGDTPAFNMTESIIGLNLTPKKFGEPRYLFYRPLASFDLNYVKTSDLKFATDDPQNVQSFRTQQLLNVLPSQAVGQVISSDGIMFLGLTRERAIACWNMRNPPSTQNIVCLFFEIVCKIDIF